MANENNKIKLLVLWDILRKNTDENHAMNADEIRAELEKRGITVIRRVIAHDIATLNEFGYEVLSYKKKYTYYYVVTGSRFARRRDTGKQTFFFAEKSVGGKTVGYSLRPSSGKHFQTRYFSRKKPQRELFSYLQRGRNRTRHRQQQKNIFSVFRLRRKA